MNAITEKPVPMVQDGLGNMRFPGVLQWPMTVEDQKRCGLIARTNVSIHPSKAKAGRTANHHRRHEDK